MVELEIDGRKIEVPAGSMVIQAAHQLNRYIPHFCYHKKLSVAANCRMCLVEVEKMPKAVPACATPVAAGMVVRTKSEKAVAAQQAVMEFLLINHPLDCPICDQGGECQLQDLAVGYGKSHSRYTEAKRVVFHKNAGPLIAMEEMTRCIHCTRCVRFGKEIAGVMELGMLGRGEHAEITAFVGQTVDSELSGNMIDLCPVGALTSKPFRYTARGWELTRYRSISPHDSVGANLIIQVKNQRVMRVLPFENEAVNECWISDKDRFSYEALNSDARLARPMVKHNGAWRETDWETALSAAVEGLQRVRSESGADSIAALASPHSTLEELYLLKQLMRGIGSPHIDFRLRQSDVRAALEGAPWLGMPITALSNITGALIIGSCLNRDHPLFAARLRQAAKNGAPVHLLNAIDDDARIASAHRLVAAPSCWLNELAGIVVAVAQIKGIAAPATFASVLPSEAAYAVAKTLAGNGGDEEIRAIFLGNLAVAHPDFSALHAAAHWIAKQSGATLGFLTEAANTVGAYIAGALPDVGGLSAAELFEQPRRAVVLLNVEVEYDAANPAAAQAALKQAEFVVSVSMFKQGVETADVLLPLAPFTETAGTFINAQGLIQSFNGVVRPFGEARPGWKILRALGNGLGLANFEYNSAEEVRAATLDNMDIAARLSNACHLPPALPERAADDSQNGEKNPVFERLSDIPIYSADPLVRRAPSLQATRAAKAARRVSLPSALFERLGLKDGDSVRIHQGACSATMFAERDARLPDNVVRIPAAAPASAQLGGLFGKIRVEKA
ncbi:NADH-quinone oxidoreductase subunit G (NADH dehydrogenase I subunit G) (NDH-1 subunit G) [Candidatus Glomeribacter gigasporarum BEG34]|uniref:NADH-quinone oxidoreductase n=1 Tax=Candidatus Glomeribacter gigasporarum BEG34 TaxID=1070319 RepID=G2J8N8_9BURK|nr:NADH-quinone oxidoreductase subunit NuoG [Candidatus Glomeribacter gigasporarum]CCD29135.1 NADH-quinone oxidoreductase subunit G (NADH dehydrogenase I subunit G) (NDH-1 subunit G) [Candidatus Glomeribacter gigasporarum BEG34]